VCPRRAHVEFVTWANGPEMFVVECQCLCLPALSRLAYLVVHLLGVYCVAWVSALGVWEIPIGSHVDAH